PHRSPACLAGPLDQDPIGSMGAAPNLGGLLGGRRLWSDAATSNPGTRPDRLPTTCQIRLAIGRNGAKALPVRGSAAASSGQWRKITLVMPLLAIQSMPSGE